MQTRPTSLDVQFVDFDGVRFHLSTPERKTCLVLSMSIRCWDELVKYGVDNVLRREYGNRVMASPEAEYNVSLELDLEQFPPEGGECICRTVCTLIHSCIEERDALIKSVSLLKRNALAAPFELAFSKHRDLAAAGSGQGELLALHYRDEEAIYVQASFDRVTVIFSTMFREETDRIFGKVFLQVCLWLPGCVVIIAHQHARNLSMPDVSLPSKARRRSSTQLGTPLWNFNICPT